MAEGVETGAELLWPLSVTLLHNIQFILVVMLKRLHVVFVKGASCQPLYHQRCTNESSGSSGFCQIRNVNEQRDQTGKICGLASPDGPLCKTYLCQNG